MVRYGNRVRICDGSPLDGVEGIAYDVKPERVWVLIDREVFWAVTHEQLEVVPNVAAGVPRTFS
jgi:hypothetical protein